MKPSAKLLAIVLLFIGLVLVNYLASKVPTRLDATSEDIYTLSSGTHSLLSKIEEPVVLDFYYSAKAQGLPISYKNYANRVQEMLRQYARVADGKLTLNVISPEPDTPEEEAASLVLARRLQEEEDAAMQAHRLWCGDGDDTGSTNDVEKDAPEPESRQDLEARLAKVREQQQGTLEGQ